MSNHPNRSRKIPRPSKLLRKVSEKFPHAWEAYENYRLQRGKNFSSWPDWCYCPQDVAHALASNEKVGDSENGQNSTLSEETLEIAALAAWRLGQGIYRFDPALAAAIMAEQPSFSVTEIVNHLPEWCLYIDAPPGLEIYGCFAFLDYCGSDQPPALYLLLDTAEQLQAISLKLSSDDIMGEIRQYNVAVQPIIISLLQLLIFICTKANYGPDQRPPCRPRPKRTKSGWKMFAPNKPVVFNLT